MYLELIERKKNNIHVESAHLGDVAEGVDGGAPDRLLVRLEQLEELEADAHPLAGGDELGASAKKMITL